MSEQAPVDPVQYEDVYVEVPQWPKVVGIISIIWGALGICCNGVGAGFYGFAMPKLMEMAEQQNGPAPKEFMAPISVTAGMAVGAVITVVLLIAGILTLRRTLAGRFAHLVYAPLSIVNTAVGTYFGMQYQNTVQEFIKAHPDSPYAKGGGGGMSGGGGVNMAIMAFMTAIAVGWPLFCLVWFGVVKRTTESMTGLPPGAERPTAAA